VYVTVLPLPVMVPAVLLPLATPSTVQATEVLVEPVTVAVRETVPLAARLEELGLKLTTTGAATVMEAEADLLLSAALVARTV
jgi:hypothetical protein